MEAIVILLQSRAREVIKSALGFIKVAVATLPCADLDLHLADLVNGLVLWNIPAFRMKTKMIFERLIRKFGHARIEACTPEEHKKLLTNIRKSKEREKRKKAARSEMDMADADNDDEVVTRHTAQPAFAAPAKASHSKASTVSHKQTYDELL